MNATRIVFAGVLIAVAASSAPAQDVYSGDPPFARMASYRTFDAQPHEKALLQSLNHDNAGVVESAIRLATLMKLAQPDVPWTDDVELTLNRLASEGATEAIRVKASLAGIVYAQPELFREEAMYDYPPGDAVFRAIATRVEFAIAARYE